MGTDIAVFANISKTYKVGFRAREVVALRGVSLAIAAGEVHGLIGLNGAGKTTLIKVLLGLLTPSGGTVTVWGKPGITPDDQRRIGFMPDGGYFYTYLTPVELLTYYARLLKLPAQRRRDRIDAVLEQVGLLPARSRLLGTFSRGMLQRAGLAQALLHEPEFVIMDEPMLGLDPHGWVEFKQIIEGLKTTGTTVFYSSHILAEAEKICDRITVIANGTVVATRPTSEIIAQHGDLESYFMGLRQ